MSGELAPSMLLPPPAAVASLPLPPSVVAHLALVTLMRFLMHDICDVNGATWSKNSKEMQVENIEHKTSKVSGCNKNGRRVKQVVSIIVKYIKGVAMCVTIPRKIDQQRT